MFITITGYYTCANGVNIPGSWLCDGHPDCGDSPGVSSEDERNCGKNFHLM